MISFLAPTKYCPLADRFRGPTLWCNHLQQWLAEENVGKPMLKADHEPHTPSIALWHLPPNVNVAHTDAPINAG